MVRRSALLLLLILLLPGGARAQAKLVNGLGELGEPTTVALVQGSPPEDGFVVCSGVLIGCDSVITTAHCFNTQVGLKTHIYVPHAGFVEIESATRHPAYVDAVTNKPPGWIDTTREDDISYVKLAQPVTGVTPAAIASLAPGNGTPGFVVGFGRDPVTEGALQNPGIKRSGGMELAACQSSSLAGLDVLCWSPSDPLPPPGEEVSTCSGDSGGPLFTDSPAGRVIAGITKGAVFDLQGQPDPCLPPVEPYDVSVARHHDWLVGPDGDGGIVAAMGSYPPWTASCSALGQLDSDFSAPAGCDGTAWGESEQARACGFEGTLGGSGPIEGRYSFDVPPDTGTLRVALNGIASATGGVDADLYLRRGAPAQTNANDCASGGSGTLGFCELLGPATGTWHVLVHQPVGEGEHQVVVSLFPGRAQVIPGPGAGAIAAAGLTILLLARRSLRGASSRRA